MKKGTLPYALRALTYRKPSSVFNMAAGRMPYLASFPQQINRFPEIMEIQQFQIDTKDKKTFVNYDVKVSCFLNLYLV